MKKLFILSTLLLSLSAHAQLEKGSKLVGLQTNLILGDIYATSLALNVSQNESNYGINLVPTLGWVLERNWVVGGQVTLGYSREKQIPFGNNNTSIYSYYDLGLAPFTRIYLDISRNKRWKFFGAAAAELAGTRTRYSIKSASGTSLISTDKHTELVGSIGMGFAYFTPKVSIDLSAAVTGLRLGVYKTFGPRKK